MIVDATVENFDTEVLKREGSVVVQFHADWCGPCKALAPHFEAASERNESVRWVRADIESLDRSILDEYKIMTIPRVIMFENGEAVKDITSRTVYGILEEVND
jgi:thioredoxin 1